MLGGGSESGAAGGNQAMNRREGVPVWPVMPGWHDGFFGDREAGAGQISSGSASSWKGLGVERNFEKKLKPFFFSSSSGRPAAWRAIWRIAVAMGMS